MTAHACHPSSLDNLGTCEGKVGQVVVQGQPWLHSKTLISEKQNQRTVLVLDNSQGTCGVQWKTTVKYKVLAPDRCFIKLSSNAGVPM